MYKDNQQISINSFYLAAFLLAKGVSLLDVEKEKFNRVNFIFPNSDEIKNLVRVFNFGSEDDPELQVNFKKTEIAIKKLKHIIYD
jgi:hypothetical protein